VASMQDTKQLSQKKVNHHRTGNVLSRFIWSFGEPGQTCLLLCPHGGQGTHEVKNIEVPVRAFGLHRDGEVRQERATVIGARSGRRCPRQAGSAWASFGSNVWHRTGRALGCRMPPLNWHYQEFSQVWKKQLRTRQDRSAANDRSFGPTFGDPSMLQNDPERTHFSHGGAARILLYLLRSIPAVGPVDLSPPPY
jgi:hypothetical protein